MINLKPTISKLREITVYVDRLDVLMIFYVFVFLYFIFYQLTG